MLTPFPGMLRMPEPTAMGSYGRFIRQRCSKRAGVHGCRHLQYNPCSWRRHCTCSSERAACWFIQVGLRRALPSANTADLAIAAQRLATGDLADASVTFPYVGIPVLKASCADAFQHILHLLAVRRPPGFE